MSTTVETVTVNAAEFFRIEILGYCDHDLRVFVLFEDDIGTFAVEDWCMDFEVPANRIGDKDISDLYDRWWNDSVFADDAELVSVKRELGYIVGPKRAEVATFRDECIEAGDYKMATLCDMALNENDPEGWEAVSAALDYV
jgi:hypothetical protein